MATLSPQIQQKFTDNDGNPLVGGKIYTYEAGTTTPLATYVSYNGSANANPVVLDANGECSMWLGSTAYKFEIKTSADVLLKTIDNVVTSTTSNAASSQLLENIGVTTSVGSNALTINLTDSLGATPSSESPVVVGFRSATLSSGLSARVSVESGVSLVVPSGATLGHSDGVVDWIYVYLINNSGVAELAVSKKYFLENGTVSTTAISTSSDSSTGLYSTTARTGVTIRLIARLTSTQTTAGTWAASISEAQTGPEAVRGNSVILHVTKNTGSVTNTPAFIGFNNTVYDPYAVWDGGNLFIAPWSDWYTFEASLYSTVFDPTGVFQSFISLHNGVSQKELIGPQLAQPDAGASPYCIGNGSATVFLRKNESMLIYGYQNATGSLGVYNSTDAANFNFLKVRVGR